VSYDYEGGGTLRCDVVDTGAGIPDDKLEAIFEPFTQLAGRGQRREGTGLGLHITRRLLALMHGSLSVKSEVGKGSIFRLKLPLPPVAGREQDRETTGNRPRVEWSTEEITRAAKKTYAALSDEEMPPPPSAELDELLNLALRGDMQGVERWAADLEAQDARYRNFAGRLKNLAVNFKTKAVLALVKRCRGEDL
ncbi:MAG: ATP-binding protein, partial [Desulfuromonadaceae bacterium]